MKKKEVKQVSLKDLALAVDPADKTLPKPRGGVKKTPIPDTGELAKLEATHKLGGLVPERSPFLDELCRKVGSLEMKK
jgi:hypothetical protein